MKCNIWNKESAEVAFTKGFTLEEIEIFNIECESFLKKLLEESFSMKNDFCNDINDLKKATWLILNDIISSNYDCLQNLKIGNIRMASRVFRDNMENMNLVEFLNESEKPKYLTDWYKDEILSHSDYRNWLKKTDEHLSTLTRDVYRIYSKYAHRTYHSILESYSLSKDKKLEYKYCIDKNNPKDLKLLSEYYSHLSYFINNSVLKYEKYKLISNSKLREIVTNHISQ